VDSESWCGLTVHTREGAVLRGVVGVFVEGPLAGCLRVHGEYALDRGGYLARPSSPSRVKRCCVGSRTA
jgi:hypothetical protein